MGILIPLPILVIGYLVMANNQSRITSTPVNININEQPTTNPSSTPLSINQPATANPQSSFDSVHSEQSRTAQDKPTNESGTITPMSKQNNSTQPNLDNFEKKIYTVTMTTTEGKIVLELDGNKTPITVNNFITLAKKGFYDNTIFHRTIANFMIQGGDPTGTGMGGPGYKFNDEKFDGEYTRGTIAMANSGPNTNGSQFFIIHADYALPKNYVIFGKVTNGIETVDKIATAPTSMSDSGENSKPVTPVKIVSIEVE